MTRLRLTTLAVLAAGLLLTSEARATQVFYQSTSLEELTAQSTVIVLARRAVPPSVTESIPIAPKDEKPDPKKYPPFERVKSRFVILEIIAGEAAKGATIEVDQAHWHQDLGAHRAYYVRHLGESPIFHRYQPSADLTKSDKLILFLSDTSGSLQFTVEGAMEAEEKQGEVRRLLSKMHPPRP